MLWRSLAVASYRSCSSARLTISDSTSTPSPAPVLPGAAFAAGSPEEGPINLEAEMVSLADEQLRYEATAKLLQKAYQNIRTSVRER